MSMMLSTVFSFLLGGWVAGPGVGSGVGKTICSVGGGRMMASATGGKETSCSASGGCTTMGSAAVLAESAVTF